MTEGALSHSPANPSDARANFATSLAAGLAEIDVSIISVSYQSRDELQGLLASLEENPASCSVEVIVVDNASADGTDTLVRERFPDVRFVQMGYNSGFSRANNAGIRSARGRYLLLLNPDTRVTPGCIDELLSFMESHREAAACGPKLLNRDRTLQYSIRNLPSLRAGLLEALFLHRLFPRLLAKHGEVVFDESVYERPCVVGWLSGAAMFVRRETLLSVGPLDEDYFLFSEEIDWFKRMNDAGLAAWFVPDAVVVHRDTTGGRNPNLSAIDVDSRRIYWSKHASRGRARVALAILALGMMIRLAIWSLIAVGGDERARRQQLSFYRGLRALTPGGSPGRPTAPRDSASARERS